MGEGLFIPSILRTKFPSAYNNDNLSSLFEPKNGDVMKEPIYRGAVLPRGRVSLGLALQIHFGSVTFLRYLVLATHVSIHVYMI